MTAKAPPRLKKRREFLAVRDGEKRRGPFLLLEVLNKGAADPSSAVESPRVGFTVTKKVGNSVVRNRVRRRLREAVRLQAADLKPGHDYVVVGRRDALDAPFQALTAEISRRFAGRPRPRG